MAKVVFSGGCLCGEVRYTSTAAPVLTAHCHCTDCRRLGGTGHSTHTVVPSDAFELTGDVTVYDRTADSGRVVAHRFCPKCASPIYHTRSGLAGLTVVRTSSMDDPELALPDRVIFSDSALSWDPIDPALPASPGMTPTGS